MDKLAALASGYALVPNHFTQDHLKLCFLWYDEVLLELIKGNDFDDWLERLTRRDPVSREERHILSDVMVPLKSRVSKDVTDRYRFNYCGSPPPVKDWRDYLHKEPTCAEQYAHNALLTQLSNEWDLSTPGMAGWAEGLTQAAVSAVRLWRDAGVEYLSQLQATPQERIVMNAISQYELGPEIPVKPFDVFEARMPELANVPWSDIVGIKRRGDFDRLRKELTKLVRAPDITFDDARARLAEAEREATEEIIEKYRPNLKRVAGEALCSTIPTGSVTNPFGLYFSFKGVREEMAKKRALDWFYLIRDIEKYAE